jgi:hypothetical protein
MSGNIYGRRNRYHLCGGTYRITSTDVVEWHLTLTRNEGDKDNSGMKGYSVQDDEKDTQGIGNQGMPIFC